MVYDLTDGKNNENGEFEMFGLDFGFCEKHKKCIFDNCEEDSVFLTMCGHRMCETHLFKSKPVWSKCLDCNEFICGQSFIENFGVHIWCNTQKYNEGHYVCFAKNPKDNPRLQKKGYNSCTWVCNKHQLDK